MKEVLKRFMLTPAPCGYEGEMARVLAEELSPYCADVSMDKCGNVIGKIAGSDSSAPRVMVFSHMDQLGFIVRKIEEDGFIQVDRMGGIPEKVLPGLRLKIRTEEGGWVSGVFGPKAHHATAPEEKYKVDFVTSLFIDVGANSRQEVNDMGIYVGCPVIYEPSFEELLNGKVTGTAIDNRGSCAVLVEVAKELAAKKPKCDVYLVGTVWEEFNLRGAMMAARTVKPQIAIGLDVTLAGDTKDLSSKYEDMMGKGPCVNLYSFHGRGTLNGTLAHEPLFRAIKAAAKRENLPMQRFAGVGLLTDLAYVQLEGDGVASIDMGFPARYTHTPVEMCCMSDLENLAKLVSATVADLDGSFHLGRY